MCSVSGIVYSPVGLPLEGARVELRNAENGNVVGSIYSGQSGDFAIRNVEMGNYELAASSGVNEVREQIHVDPSGIPVALHIPGPVGSKSSASGPTVSVSHFQVPDKARKEYERAEKAYSQGKPADARQHLGKALEILPKYSEALTLNGILDMTDNKIDSAVENLQSAIDADPSYPVAYFVMAAALNTKRQYQQARATVERGVALSPNAWQGHFEMAKADLGLADYKSALQSARRAAAINQKFPAIQLAEAHALMGLKRYGEAAKLYEQYLSSEPSGPDLAAAQNGLDRARSHAVTADK